MNIVEKTPGVYIQEISLLPSSVAGISTAIPAFIGYTEKAGGDGRPLDGQATRINSPLEYKELYGGAENQRLTITVEDDIAKNVAVTTDQASPYLMYYQVLIYFLNGGGPCYIISVNGNNVTTNHNLHSFFENTAGKIVNLRVSTKADGSSARSVKVTPISNESAIRNRAWVEGNIKKVDEATNGQVAYVYVPNTTTAGHQYFKRYFFPQAHKKAIIVDERYNGGGSLADYYIDILKRPLNAHWKFRYGNDLKSPSASIQGPKVLIVNETSSSGGDYFPYLFRQAKLGTIVGKRTWGGLVGVLGYPELIDGGIVTSPNVAFYNENGYRIENEGVAPDIDVEQLPELVAKGHDPQLEKAIEIALKGLKENPPKEMKAPAFPIRARK